MKWRSQDGTSKLDVAICDFKQSIKSDIYKLDITNCDLKIK